MKCGPEQEPAEVPGAPDLSLDVPAEFRRWRQSVQIGFHQNRSNPRSLELYYQEACADGWTLRGAYDTEGPPEELPSDYPVATFASFAKDINVGAGRLLPAHLITEVTVRPTHRRRGILRRMMTDDLTEARDRGVPIAVLTATEATIYGRFGFGPTTFINRIQVKTDRRFKLRVEPTGRIHMTSRDQIVELAPSIFAECHRRNVGSVGRTRNYTYLRAGHWSYSDQASNDTVRNIIHMDEDGKVDGYASYSVTDEITKARTLTILDLCSADSNAHLALLSYLASIDLVERIDWGMAPVDDPLEWALEDRRCYRVTERTDLIWGRILDPVEVLSARAYPGMEARLTIEIEDPMGFAGGTFALHVRDGQGTVESTEAAADITLGVDALASLYLGGTDARTLAASGRLNGSPEAISCAQQVFTSLGAPYANTYF